MNKKIAKTEVRPPAPPVDIQSAAKASKFRPPMRAGKNHPFQNADRSVRAALARLSGGVSTHAFTQAAWDWAQHLGQSPGRQLELVVHAQRNALKLMASAAGVDAGAAPPLSPNQVTTGSIILRGRNHPSISGNRGFLQCRTGGTSQRTSCVGCNLRTRTKHASWPGRLWT